MNAVKNVTHTPGPWKLSTVKQPVAVCNQRIDCFEITAAKDACWIAQVQNHRSCINTPEGDANARLIAAAPELLEALKTALTLLDRDVSNCTYDDLSAVVAKAEGRQ